MLKLTLGFIAALLCFLTGVAVNYTYHARPHRAPAAKSEVAELPDSTHSRGSGVPPRRGGAAGLDESILDRVARAVSHEGDGFRFAPALCTCPGIIPDQKFHYYGWLSRGANFAADAYVAEAHSAEAAAAAMAARREGRDGRRVYSLGDEAYLRQGQGGRFGTMTLRVRNVVAQVGGELKAVEMLSKHVADALAAG